MSWIDLVSNPQGLREIFQGDPRPLLGASVHEISVDREGPSLRLRLDLPDYPAVPPRKWHLLGFNTVQVELLFGGVSDLSLTGISTEIVADVAIRRDGTVILDLTSPTMRVSALAASVTVTKVSAYLDGGRHDAGSAAHGPSPDR